MSIQKTKAARLAAKAQNEEIASPLNLQAARNDMSPHATTPFFSHLQLAWANPRIKGQEICQKPIEFGRLIDHGEMTGIFHFDLMGHGRKGILAIRGCNGRILVSID